MNYSLTDVQTAICSNQGSLFEYIARIYTFDTFVKFVPDFMNSNFCRIQWDVPYSRYQFDLIDENLDFLMPELKQVMQFVPASADDRIFEPGTANWIGFTYRQLQILTTIPSRQLVNTITLDDLCSAYPGLHTVNDEMSAQWLITDKLTASQPAVM